VAFANSISRFHCLSIRVTKSISHSNYRNTQFLLPLMALNKWHLLVVLSNSACWHGAVPIWPVAIKALCMCSLLERELLWWSHSVPFTCTIHHWCAASIQRSILLQVYRHSICECHLTMHSLIWAKAISDLLLERHQECEAIEAHLHLSQKHLTVVYIRKWCSTLTIK